MRWRAILLPAFAVALSSCRDEIHETEPLDRAHWHARVYSGCSPRPRGPHVELVVLDLPEAAHPSWEGPAGDESPRGVVVNLQSDQSIYFRGKTWRSDGMEDDRAITGLTAALRAVVEARRIAAKDGREGDLILVRVDALAPWGGARRIIHVLRQFADRLPRLRIGVEARTRGMRYCNGYLGAEWGRSPEIGESAAVPPLAIELESEASQDGHQPTRLQAAGRRWEFPKGENWTRENWTRYKGEDETKHLAAANRIWEELEAVAAESRAAGSTAVELNVGDEVRWAFVVAVLDICVGNRLLDVRFRGSDLALRLGLPEGPPPAFLPGDPDPRDWSTPLALTIGAVAAGIAYGLGRLLPGRRRRERPS